MAGAPENITKNELRDEIRQMMSYLRARGQMNQEIAEKIDIDEGNLLAYVRIEKPKQASHGMLLGIRGNIRSGFGEALAGFVFKKRKVQYESAAKKAGEAKERKAARPSLADRFAALESELTRIRRLVEQQGNDIADLKARLLQKPDTE